MKPDNLNKVGPKFGDINPTDQPGKERPFMKNRPKSGMDISQQKKMLNKESVGEDEPGYVNCEECGETFHTESDEAGRIMDGGWHCKYCARKKEKEYSLEEPYRFDESLKETNMMPPGFDSFDADDVFDNIKPIKDKVSDEFEKFRELKRDDKIKIEKSPYVFRIFKSEDSFHKLAVIDGSKERKYWELVWDKDNNKVNVFRGTMGVDKTKISNKPRLTGKFKIVSEAFGDDFDMDDSGYKECQDCGRTFHTEHDNCGKKIGGQWFCKYCAPHQEEEKLDETNAVGGGAMAGFNVPLGFEPEKLKESKDEVPKTQELRNQIQNFITNLQNNTKHINDVPKKISTQLPKLLKFLGYAIISKSDGLFKSIWRNDKTNHSVFIVVERFGNSFDFYVDEISDADIIWDKKRKRKSIFDESKKKLKESKTSKIRYQHYNDIMKNSKTGFKLSEKEKSRASEDGITIIVRPMKHSNHLGVFAVNVSDGKGVGINWYSVESKSDIPEAVRMLNRDLNKFHGKGDDMSDRGRDRPQEKFLKHKEDGEKLGEAHHPDNDKFRDNVKNIDGYNAIPKALQKLATIEIVINRPETSSKIDKSILSQINEEIKDLEEILAFVQLNFDVKLRS